MGTNPGASKSTAVRLPREPDYEQFEECANAGHIIIPLNGKRPIDPNWTARIYDNADTLARIKKGKHNAGIRIAKNIYVLDPDVTDAAGNSGMESYAKLCRDIDTDFDSFHRVISGGNGRHVYMKTPPGFRGLTNLGTVGYPGIQARRIGMQMVLPGSVHPETNRLYRWDDTSPQWANPFCKIPDRLLAIVRLPEATTHSAVESGQYSLSQIERRLEVLEPIGMDYDSWLRLGMAVKYAGGDAAFDVWQKWNERDPKYIDSEAANLVHWNSFDCNHPNGVTSLTLDWLVREAGHGDVLAQDDFDDEPADTNADKAARVSRFKGMTLSELRTLPPLEFVLSGIVPVNSLFEIYGREKTGKTFFASDLGFCIATGEEFHGLKVKQGRVLHIVAEGNKSSFRNRVEAWIIAKCGSPVRKAVLEELIEQNWRIVGVPVCLDVASDVKDFLAANPGELTLVIVDTLIRNMVGHMSDPKDMAAFVRGCDKLREDTGAAVLVLHHEGKDKAKGGMGSVVMNAAVDGIGNFYREGPKRIFSIVALRDGDDNQPDMEFELQSIPVKVVFNDDGEEIENQRSAVLKLLARKQKRKKTSAPLDTLLVAIHRQGARKQSELVGPAMSKQSVSRLVKELRKAGYLESDSLTLTADGLSRAVELATSDENDE